MARTTIAVDHISKWGRTEKDNLQIELAHLERRLPGAIAAGIGNEAGRIQSRIVTIKRSLGEIR